MVQSSTRKVYLFVTTKVGGWPLGRSPMNGGKGKGAQNAQSGMQNLDCGVQSGPFPPLIRQRRTCPRA